MVTLHHACAQIRLLTQRIFHYHRQQVLFMEYSLRLKTLRYVAVFTFLFLFCAYFFEGALSERATAHNTARPLRGLGRSRDHRTGARHTYTLIGFKRSQRLNSYGRYDNYTYIHSQTYTVMYMHQIAFNKSPLIRGKGGRHFRMRETSEG